MHCSYSQAMIDMKMCIFSWSHDPGCHGSHSFVHCRAAIIQCVYLRGQRCCTAHLIASAYSSVSHHRVCLCMCASYPALCHPPSLRLIRYVMSLWQPRQQGCLLPHWTASHRKHSVEVFVCTQVEYVCFSLCRFSAS